VEDSVQHQTAELVCDFFEVTATIGEGSGESLNRLPVGPHELILADAGYCSVAGIEHVWHHGADVLVRVNPQSFVAYSARGGRISLLPRLRTLSKAGQFGEWRVLLHGQGSAFAGRLCAVRKSDWAIQQAHRRLQRRASKKQMITRPGTLELAKYVIVFTTRSSGSTADVLRSYRMRWQIELVFKRLKSLAQLGHVPKHDDRSSRAWLYGKLLVTLLAQKLIRIARYFPLGLSPLGARDHVVRRVNSVSRFTRSSKRSNRTSPCSKRSIHGTRLHKLLLKSRATDYFNWRNGMPREITPRPTGNVLPFKSDFYAKWWAFLARNFRVARYPGVTRPIRSAVHML
jgi:hypothetical protein